MNCDLLVSKGVDYAAAAVLNWNARRSKIIRYYVSLKVYEESSLYHRDIIRVIIELEKRTNETIFQLRECYQQQKRLDKILSDLHIDISA